MPTRKPKSTKPNARQRLRKVALMAYLEPEQAAALRDLSSKTGAPVNYYVRRGVDLVLAEYSKEKTK